MSRKGRFRMPTLGRGGGDDDAGAPDGADGDAAHAPSPRPRDSYAAILRGDLHVSGELSLPDGILLEGDLRAEDGAVLDAFVEVHGDVTLGARARATHALVVHGDLTLEPGATARACNVDGDVTLKRGATVEGALECDALYLDDGLESTGAAGAPVDAQAA